VNSKFEEIFHNRFGTKPVVAVRAPGRVNLIGEHTDYNQGFVFPVALECEVKIWASPRPDSQVYLYSLNFEQDDRFELLNLKKTNLAPWSNYVRGVIKELQYAGYSIRGFNALIYGDVPVGSGLSSSAALEVATAVMLVELFKLQISKPELALLCQQAENNFVGVNCGIMDQFISLLGEKDKALLIDCRDLTYKAVPLPMEGFSLVICDSRAPRELAASAYNQRRQECQEGVLKLKRFYPSIKSLRDVSLEQFKAVELKISEIVRKRCRHVITENDRTLRAVEVLKAGNMEDFGKLMVESHHSLRDDYEVSSAYLDILVEAALDGKECLGARLTGAGFGGCTINLVRTKGLPLFKERVSFIYREQTDKAPVIYSSSAGRGAGLLSNYNL
jgi:galactokinase